MTPQEVIKKFMAELNANTYTYDTSSVGTAILDNAVRSISTEFTSVQDVIDQMKADQTAAEKLAVEEILGSNYADKTISQVDSSILSADAKDYDTANIGNGYLDQSNDGRTTVERLIKERQALIFLEKYCGIVLENNFYIGSNDAVTGWTGDTTGNVDTGAITGSDANLTLTVGDVVNGSTLTSANLSTLATKYGTAASLSGDTLIIGTGVEKTETSIVPEEGDMYLFTAAGTAKNINTGSNGWVVNATSGNDTITSGGRDSINAGTGDDKIIANADDATITTGAGSDSVEISASVTSVTITDLDSSDTITISGTFEIGNAQIENSMLVVTDKTGTRKIKFSDLTNVGNSKIGSQTISDWLSDSGFSLSDLSSSDSSSGDVATSDTSSGDVSADAGRVAIDPNYKPAQIDDVANQDSVDQTQEISSATEINLGEVTIESGTVTAGGATVGTVESVSPAVMNFTTRGLTIHVGDGTATSYNSLTSAQKMMVAALFKWWAKESLTLNEESYNLGFESDTAKVTDITLSFESLGGKTLAQVGSYYRDGDGQVYQLELQISTDYYNNFEPDDKNGTSTVEGAGFLDRTLAHEFTHAVMSTNINNFAYLPQFLKEGMAELTHGIDDERGNEIFALAYNSSSLTSALNLNDTGTGDSIAYSGGYMFLRYLAKQVALQTLSDDFAPGEITATVNLGSGNATYYVSGNSTLETATTSAQNISLGSASGSTYTIGNTGVNQIINTNSTATTAKNIVGVGHNASVTGGAGNDTIQFVEGSLIDAAGGNNSIVGSGQFATITAGTGNDSVIVDGSSNSIALGDGNNLASIGGSYTYNNTITGGAGNDTLITPVVYDSQINLGDGDNSISVGARTSTIQTGDGADSITFFYGNDSYNLISLGAGNDIVDYLPTNNTIEMGAGDDYVGQSDGNNVFLYNGESGNDTIWFFRSTDTLVIAGDYVTETSYTYSGGTYVDISVSIKSGDSVTGTVLLKQAFSPFTEAANIVTVEAAESSEENSLLISLTAGNDSYSNSVEGATIQALGGNDSIYNYGDSVSIDAGAGDDSVYNYTGANISIDTGDGNDSVYNGNSNVTIKTGEGNDLISNGYSVSNEVSIDAGDGNDSVYSVGDSVTINTDAGDDFVDNSGDSVTIDGGTGNDFVVNSGNSVTINTGADNDTISNLFGNNVTINAGNGNDSVSNYSSNVTINTGAGDDKILFSLGSSYYGNYSNNELIEYTDGDGADTVWGFNATSTLKIGNGTTDTYSVTSSGNDIIVTVGEGSIKLIGAATLDAVNISGTDETPSEETSLLVTLTEGNDSYSNSIEGATIQALAGDDSITNIYASVSIDAGAGDDTVTNAGDSVTIVGGTGEDLIDNIGSSVSIDGGEDDDVIQNYSDEVSINGGNGADTISNVTGYNNTLSGGAGNDSIVNRGITVSDADATDDLPAGFYVGDSLTLDGGDGADTISNEGGSNVSINGGIGNDNITNYGASVSIDAGAGDDSITNEGNSVTIDGGTGEDLIDNIGASVSIDGGEDDDVIQNYGDEVSINGGDGADTISNVVGTGNTLSGGAGNDSIVNRGITVSDADATTELPAGFYVGDSLTLDGGDGADTIVNEGGSNISIIGGAGDDSISNNSAEKVTITTGAGNDTIKVGESVTSFTVTDFSAGDVIELNDSVSSISVESGSLVAGDVTIGGITEIGDEEFSWTFADGTATYAKKTSGGVQLSADGKTITYASGDSSETVFTLSGLNSSLTADDLKTAIEVSDGKIILSADVLAQKNITLTTSGDYALKLAADCPKVTATEKSWALDSVTATYHAAGKSEGYTLTNSKTVTYTTETLGKTLLTVDGLTSGLQVTDGAIDGLTVSGKILTVTPEVVGNEFSISEGYKIVFAAGNYSGSKFTGTSAKDTIEVNGSALSIDGGAGNDTITSSGDGGNIYLFDATGGKDVIKGYGDDDTIKITDDSEVTASVKGNDVIITVGKGSMTLKDAAKNGTHLNVVDTDGETLIGETFYADKIVDGNSVTLTSAFKEKIYTADESINAVDGSAVSGKFSLIGGDENNTLIGGKGANFINGGGGENILTGGKGNDTFVTGNGNDTITDYGVGTDKISLGADVTDFSIEDGNIVLNFDDETSLTIQNGDGKKINFLQNGKVSTEIFTEDGKTNTGKTSITLAAAVESYTAPNGMVTIDGGLTDDVWIVGNTKANKIFGGAGDDTLNGGSGKDTLTGGAGEDIFIYESGKDTITDYVSGDDKISLSAATTSETLDKKGNVVLKFGSSNSLTISKGDTASVRTITFTGDNGDTTKTYYSERIVGADGVTLQSTFQGNTFTATNDLPNVDASAVTKKFTLTGGVEDNTLIGGKGANLIDGGAGSDLLIGNGGNDTFVYSSGDDTIGDYDVKDSISLSSAIKDFDLSGDDVIIGFASGSLTIQDSAGKSITFVETTGTKVTNSVNVFAADGIFNNTTTTKATAVTLAADTSTFNAKSYSKLIEIDGGILSSDASIVGNAKNNLIFAGDNGATINGGGGNDSLWGGSGSDTFIYESGGGKDVVYNFGDEDALQISGTFTASVKDKSIAFKVGSTANALTLKDYSATSFNINGDAYQISGTSLTKK